MHNHSIPKWHDEITSQGKVQWEVGRSFNPAEIFRPPPYSSLTGQQENKHKTVVPVLELGIEIR